MKTPNSYVSNLPLSKNNTTSWAQSLSKWDLEYYPQYSGLGRETNLVDQSQERQPIGES